MVVLNDLVKKRACQAVDVVARRTPVRAAFVFGSQAAGTAHEWSDIDVAAFIENAHELGLKDRIRLGLRPANGRATTLRFTFFRLSRYPTRIPPASPPTSSATACGSCSFGACSRRFL